MPRVSGWTTISSIKDKLTREYEKGIFFRDWIDGNAGPFAYPCKVPTVRDCNERIADVRIWRDTLFEYEEKCAMLTFEHHTRTHRKVGEFTYPGKVIFGSESDRLRFIGKLQEFELFKALYIQTCTKFPMLQKWISRYPMKLVENSGVWHGILDFCNWMLNHQQPGIYVRAVPVTGIHTKFVEQNRGIITELLNLLLPEEAINHCEKDFDKRFGFKVHVPLESYITFRFLDDGLRKKLGYPYMQMRVRASEMAAREIPAKYVFAVENLKTFEAFPDFPEAICFYGCGNMISSRDGLSTLAWLRDKQIYYFGDLDPSGFLILNRFREFFPGTRSILMDMETLEACKDLCVQGKANRDATFDRLTDDETRVVETLCKQAVPLMLEQERIPLPMLETCLHGLKKANMA